MVISVKFGIQAVPMTYVKSFVERPSKLMFISLLVFILIIVHYIFGTINTM